MDTFISQFKALEAELRDINIRCLLVNDGSTKNMATQDIIRLKNNIPSLRYISYDENRGKGYAVRIGMQSVESEISAFTDVDFPYDPQCLHEMYKLVNLGQADIVVGHRASNYYDKIPVLRKWLSKGLQRIVRFLLHIPVSDTQGGIKAFNRNGIETLLQTTLDRYLFDIELLKIGQQQNLTIQSIPLTMRPGFTSKNMSPAIILHEMKNFVKLIIK